LRTGFLKTDRAALPRRKIAARRIAHKILILQKNKKRFRRRRQARRTANRTGIATGRFTV
jgi:hypothetical protein